MKTVEMTPEVLDAASRTLAGKGPVQMVNLLRYRAQADYGVHAALPSCSGQEAYFQRYVPAFARVAERVAPGEAFRPVLLGNVQATLVAPPDETWDDIAVLEYPSFETLRCIIVSPEYQAEAAPHRRAALEDWRFVAVLRMEVPG